MRVMKVVIIVEMFNISKLKFIVLVLLIKIVMDFNEIYSKIIK